MSIVGVVGLRVQSIVGLDRSIGSDHMTVTPERGFGGACLPKDLDGLIAVSRQQGQPAPVLTAIAEYNGAIRTSGDIEPVHGGETTRS